MASSNGHFKNDETKGGGAHVVPCSPPSCDVGYNKSGPRWMALNYWTVVGDCTQIRMEWLTGWSPPMNFSLDWSRGSHSYVLIERGIA